jgi:hypothetical protein
MAINLAKLNIMAADKVNGISFGGDTLTAIYEDNGDLILKTYNTEISLNKLMARLNALEEAYMELVLLGKRDE